MVVLTPIRWLLIFDFDDMDDSRCVTGMETLDAQPETIATEVLLMRSDCDSLESQSDSEAAGAWSFRALVRGPEWDPSLFTRVLTECTSSADSALKTTLAMTSIFSYACSDKSSVVPDGYVAVDGYLKIEGSKQVRRETLWRRLRHPDLWSIEWTTCMVGRNGRYTDHDFIARFHRETALPPAGVLQRSPPVCGRGRPQSARGLPWAQRRSPQQGRLDRL